MLCLTLEQFQNADSSTGTKQDPCKVCGDKSSGFHYGVTSCEGCKVSFNVINLQRNNFFFFLLFRFFLFWTFFWPILYDLPNILICFKRARKFVTATQSALKLIHSFTAFLLNCTQWKILFHQKKKKANRMRDGWKTV